MALLTNSMFSWRRDTRTINKIKTPNQLLQNWLFSAERFNITDYIELTKLSGGREIPAMVKKGSRAQLIKGFGRDIDQIMPPTLRYKMEISPGKYINNPSNGVGGGLVEDDGVVLSEAERLIAQDLLRFEHNFVNTVEWMCGQALSRKIIYSDTTNQGSTLTPKEDTMSFQVTYPKDALSTLTSVSGATAWGTADPAVMLRTAKSNYVELNGVVPTDLILGANVGAAIAGNTLLIGNFNQTITGNPGLTNNGPMVVAGDPRLDGSIFEGRYAGLNWFTYPRKVTLLNSDMSVAASEFVIDPDSAYLVSNLTTTEDFGIEYGGVEDYEAIQEGNMRTKRFTKTIVEGDPSAVYRVAESRPIPVLYNSDAVFELTPLETS